MLACIATFAALSAAIGHAAEPTATSETAIEIAPPESLPCFPGAYYRKAVSSVDHWTGIEGIVTLPTPNLDPERRKPTGRFLDNPSIYMGGRSGEQEIDAGLTWEIVREPDGSVSTVAKAFRPFWRNKGWNSAPAKPEYYYYPGDTVRMRCAVAGPGRLRIEVELVSRAGSGESAGDELTSSSLYTIPYETTSVTATATAAATPVPGVFSVDFDAPGFGPDALQEFKRVNAIDQSGNEGKDVSPTRAFVEGAVWSEVWLLRGDERLPMIPSRYTDMRCPDPSRVVVAPAGAPGSGGERISIHGDPATKP